MYLECGNANLSVYCYLSDKIKVLPCLSFTFCFEKYKNLYVLLVFACFIYFFFFHFCRYVNAVTMQSISIATKFICLFIIFF